LGISAFIDEHNLFRIMGNIGSASTNNTAEYSGLIISLIILKLFKNNIDSEVHMVTDSELVCKQIKGEYKTSTPHIHVLHSISRSLIDSIKATINISHVFREYNTLADYLSIKAKDINENSLIIYY
jgi:ribonuclease HI